MAQNSEVLKMFTVYRHPSDHPDKWVVRGWNIIRGSLEPIADLNAAVCETIDEARSKVPPGMTRMDRMPDDDPVIYEVWI